LRGVDELRLPVGDWVDAMYAMVPEIPDESLRKLRDSMTTAEAMIDPKRARETWGLTEDHQAMGGNLETAPEIGQELPGQGR
jgi:hypothetical protein